MTNSGKDVMKGIPFPYQLQSREDTSTLYSSGIRNMKKLQTCFKHVDFCWFLENNLSFILKSRFFCLLL